MSFILGISGFYHDSSVALVKEGVLIEYYKEESFTRVKGTSHFPKKALLHLIKKYNLNNLNVDLCVFYEKPFLSWGFITYFSLKKPFLRWKVSSNQFKKLWNGSLTFSNNTKNILNLDDKKNLYSPHHLSHALTSISFDKKEINSDKLIFVVDAVGDGETISIFEQREGNFNKIYVENFPNSIGLFYSAITDYLGYSVNEGEFKVMGLASYGEPVFKEFILKNIISWDVDKLFFNMKWFDFDKNPERTYSKKFEHFFGKIPKKSDFYLNNNNFIKLTNIACSFQCALEEILKKMVTWAINKTGIDNIYFSGGVGLNSRAMQKVAEMKIVRRFTVPPSPADAGSSIGAASFGSYVLNKKFLNVNSLFFSNDFYNPNTNIRTELFKKVKYNDFYEFISRLILNNEYVCTFVNGAEIGPRSLGHRSILCSAKDKKISNKLNTLIKGRENFRPLAPVLMKDDLSKYFFTKRKYEHNLEWMGITLKAKNETLKKYPSCVHIDHTSRVQTISDKGLFLYKLLEKMKTFNHDILINTSFNFAGDPIVFDYIDCYIAMKKMNLKYLVTENEIFIRK